MILTRSNIQRAIAALAVGAVLTTASIATPTWAAPAGADQMKQEWARHRQQMVNAHLAKMAERLEIKSSQQGAWQAFAGVVGTMPDNNLTHPDANADAATIAKFNADIAAAHAAKLAQIADATAKLEQVLTPDQRKTLDGMAQHFQHRGHPWKHHEQHGMREHDGGQH